MSLGGLFEQAAGGDEDGMTRGEDPRQFQHSFRHRPGEVRMPWPKE